MASRGFFNFDPFDAFLDPFGSYNAQQYRQPYDTYNAPYTGRRAQGSHWIDDFFPYGRPAAEPEVARARAPASRKTRKPAEEKSVPIEIRVDGPDPKPKQGWEAAAAAVARKRRPSTEEAAVRLQARVRGLLARNSFRAVYRVHRDAVAAWKSFCDKEDVLRRHEREKAAAGELLMKLLLRLDAVRGVRGYRRKITKLVIAMQDTVENLGKPKLPKAAAAEAAEETIETEIAEETVQAKAAAKETVQVEEVEAAAEEETIVTVVADETVQAEAAAEEAVQVEEAEAEAAEETTETEVPEETVQAEAAAEQTLQVEEVEAAAKEIQAEEVEVVTQGTVQAEEVVAKETLAEEVEVAAQETIQAEVVAEKGIADAAEGRDQMEDKMAVETTAAQDSAEHIDEMSLEETMAAPDTTEYNAEIGSMDAVDTPTKMVETPTKTEAETSTKTEAETPTKTVAEGSMTAGEAEDEAKEEEGVNVDKPVGSNAEGEWEMVPEALPWPCLEPVTKEIVIMPVNDGGVDIEKMVNTVMALSEQNKQQSVLIAALVERVDTLECKVRQMEEDREATMTASSTVTKD